MLKEYSNIDFFFFNVSPKRNPEKQLKISLEALIYLTSSLDALQISICA